MLALLFLSGSALLGVGVVRRTLRGLLDSAELLMWGTVTGWMLTTVVVYALASLLGRLTYLLMVWTTAGIWLVSIALLVGLIVPLRRSVRLAWQPQYTGLALVLLLFAPIFWRLFSTHMLARGAGGLFSGGTAWYDLSFHAALSSSFVYGGNFPPIYTPLPPERLLYPFMPDFQTAILMSAGLDFHAALLTTALPLAFVITGLFYSLAFRLVSSRRAAVLATILFLLNGGLGFIELLRDWGKSGLGFFTFWNTLAVNYANAWDRGIHWTNLIVDTFLPQRTSLYGLSVGLMIFTLFAIVWRRDFEKTEKVEAGTPSSRTLLLLAGLLAGLLPFFHAHTYLAVGLISCFLFAMRPHRNWLAFWIPAVLVAAPQLWNLTHHLAANGVLRFQPGWMGHSAKNFPLYLLYNFGISLVLIVPAWLTAPRLWQIFYLAFVLLFIFSLTVMVSPNIYDNSKLMYYWHAVNCILIASWLVKFAIAPWRRCVALLLVLVAIASGLAALQSEDLAVRPLFTDDEIVAARFVREHTLPRALFLTAPVINQPVLCLAGRPVLRGATSWLWSHGYEFAAREADVKSIYAGTDEAPALIDYYGIDYIYFGPAEQSGANREFFERQFATIYRSQNIAIYDTRRKNADPLDARLPATVAPREFASRLERDPYQLLVEFPRVSYAVYRLYKVALGRRPRYEEYLEDMKIVGRGLFVGASGWQQILETNKSALAEKWLERTDFKARYDNKSNRQYVDELFANAGQIPNGALRDELFSALDKGSQSRAAVLNRIAESVRSDKADYNEAYVLIHYFGYLHRNPDDPPDNNLRGFNFWLEDLNHTGDYRSLTRSFIESDEYKDRGQ
jgi:hypothetical protein